MKSLRLHPKALEAISVGDRIACGHLSDIIPGFVKRYGFDAPVIGVIEKIEDGKAFYRREVWKSDDPT